MNQKTNKTLRGLREISRTAHNANVSKLIFVCLATALLTNVALAQGEKKIAYGILIDNTGSLRTQFADEIALGKAVAKQVLPRGPVSLFCFASQGVGKNAAVTPGTEWSQDERAVRFNLENLYVQGGQTVLLDAIAAMAESLDAKVDRNQDEFQGKVIILITDGEDRASKVKKEALVARLKASGIIVYAIGLVQELNHPPRLVGRDPRGIAEDLLKAITKETGGRVIFPKPKQRDVDALVSELLAR